MYMKEMKTDSMHQASSTISRKLSGYGSVFIANCGGDNNEKLAPIIKKYEAWRGMNQTIRNNQNMPDNEAGERMKCCGKSTCGALKAGGGDEPKKASAEEAAEIRRLGEVHAYKRKRASRNMYLISRPARERKWRRPNKADKRENEMAEYVSAHSNNEK